MPFTELFLRDDVENSPFDASDRPFTVVTESPLLGRMFAKRLRLGDGGWPSARPVVERCTPRVPAEETSVASGGRAEELPTSRFPPISEVSDAEEDEDEDEISERRRRRRRREREIAVFSANRFESTPLPFEAGCRGGGEYPV